MGGAGRYSPRITHDTEEQRWQDFCFSGVFSQVLKNFPQTASFIHCVPTEDEKTIRLTKFLLTPYKKYFGSSNYGFVTTTVVITSSKLNT